MKVAVYTIAKNEAKFVKRWFESAKDADYLLIADTGSVDDTIKHARWHDINVIKIDIKPWRFDQARNAALDALPNDIDYCIALDMDEVLIEGWRAHLEQVPAGTTRPRYSYTWSWKEDGTPGLVYGGDKIHARHGYRWKHPVHEVLMPQGIEIQHWTGLEIHHHPDSTKSRGQYFPLLKLAVEEDPDDDRNAFYYARELFFHAYRDQAIAQFKRHLSLPRATWKPERAASMRYLAKLEEDRREWWLRKATDEAPERREAWVELADFYHQKKQWHSCYYAARRALEITEKPLEYLCEDFAWGALPHDLTALAAFHIGLRSDAIRHGHIAVELNPNDERLRTNLQHYERRDA